MFIAAHRGEQRGEPAMKSSGQRVYSRRPLAIVRRSVLALFCSPATLNKLLTGRPRCADGLVRVSMNTVVNHEAIPCRALHYGRLRAS